MRRRTYLATIGTVALAGCSGDDNGGSAANQSGTPISEHEYQGSDGGLIEDIELDGGITIIDATIEDGGKGPYTGQNIDVLKTDGSTTLYHWPRMENDYAGERADYLPEGTYTIDISVTGEWGVTVRHPRGEPLESFPAEHSGSHDSVFGPYEFAGQHSAECSSEGPFLQVNVIGETQRDSATVFQNVETSDETVFNYQGRGYIEIRNDIPWDLKIESVSSE